MKLVETKNLTGLKEFLEKKIDTWPDNKQHMEDPIRSGIRASLRRLTGITKVKKLIFVLNPRNVHWIHAVLDLENTVMTIFETYAHQRFTASMESPLKTFLKFFLTSWSESPNIFYDKFFDTSLDSSKWTIAEPVTSGLQKDAHSCGPMCLLDLYNKLKGDGRFELLENVMDGMGRSFILMKILLFRKVLET